MTCLSTGGPAAAKAKRGARHRGGRVVITVLSTRADLVSGGRSDL